MQQFRTDYSSAKKQGMANAVVAGGVGVALSEPNYEYVGPADRPIPIITPQEQQRIASVTKSTMSSLESNAEAMRLQENLRMEAEKRIAGARLHLYHELADIWSNKLYPKLIEDANDMPAELVTIGNSSKAGERVVIREYDPQKNKMIERSEQRALEQSFGSILVTPKQELTHATIRVFWKGTFNTEVEWYAYFDQISPAQPFVIPACAEFSTLLTPLVLPVESRENKKAMASPLKCEFTLTCDEGRQSMTYDLPNRESDRDKDVRAHRHGLMN